ncbi:MlaE family ABC transporter permease [Nitrosomonas halophila]|uniref:Phospholipid/cholesterol/gamma-HCH transport system permease protein n=1 Tax=Nitrosomonas halophila TaxID=44576 RepID=A0A1H3G8E2_9PROT|nr:ABC transporter permease [Nitrosomonas halophila]SDX99613.1 phospholipid/cholesterol/gamma-HCH transport system permease protein [Nitrosomonas halophila]
MSFNPSTRTDDTWYRLVVQGECTCVQLAGSYTLMTLDRSLPGLARELTRLAAQSGVHWDLTGIQQMDYAGAAMLWQAWGGQRPAYLSLRPEQEKMFMRLEKAAPLPASPHSSAFLPITMLGRRLFLFLSHVAGIIALSGQVALDMLYLIAHPGKIPMREISANLFRTGAQALGITAIVGFLIGIVLSYLSSEQLHMFGADIFIVNILGMSIIRELGPMLAAILVAGRSGSSMTAQLGVMRVTEELDALTVMGIPYSLRLILPKIIGLGIALPLIVVWTSAIALLGGIMAADLQIGLSFHYALTRLPDAVPVVNLWLALGKGLVCGMTIALIACHFGLRIKPNTESLGEGTTNSVVVSITAVIIIDAIFAVVFSNVGLRIAG